MVESMAATSLLGHTPIIGHYPKHCSVTRLAMNPNRFPRVRVQPIKAQAMELTREVYNFKEEEERFKKSSDNQINTNLERKLWPPNNKADNPSLQNPLLRQERMGCGWLGAIFEWEGVLIEDNPDLEHQSWLLLSQEEAKSPPPTFILKRIEGMKNEHAISEVLCWTRDPSQLNRISSRKEQIYQSLQRGIYRFRDGSKQFLNLLTRYNIPIALVSTRPRKNLEEAIRAIGITSVLTAVVASEDVYRGKPDPEMFSYAAQLLQFIPERCIVFGNSNSSVEAAHDARMKCVAVASKHPVYELGAADLVVRWLDELSIVDLKNLADVESEFGAEPEVEMELEKDDAYPSSRVAVDDDDDGLW